MKRIGTVGEKIALEALIEMRNDQESSRDKLTYVKSMYDEGIATEGATNNIKGQLIQKLYLDILGKSNIDFGKIPNSKGNFANYEHYQMIQESIDALNMLMENKPKELEILNKLNENIITLRSDFEFGFKFDIEIIQLTYNMSVMTLFGLLNYCVSVYTNYLKEVNGITMKFGKVKKNDLIVVNSAASLNKIFSSGEWTNIVKTFKGKDSHLLGSILGAATSFSTQGIGAALSAVASSPIAIPVIVTVSVVSLLVILRWVIYYFYELSAKVDSFVSIQKEFLDTYMSRTKDSDTAVAKQQKMLAKLEGISNTIDARIFRADTAAKREISKSNKKDFSMAEINDTNKSVSSTMKSSEEDNTTQITFF